MPSSSEHGFSDPDFAAEDLDALEQEAIQRRATHMATNRVNHGASTSRIPEPTPNIVVTKRWETFASQAVERASFGENTISGAKVARGRWTGREKGKGKAMAYSSDDMPYDDEEDGNIDSPPEQDMDLPSFDPFMPLKHTVDPTTMNILLYPTNPRYPTRSYQKSIVQASVLNNTLVSLPTGLGKTFIAAAVMLNFYRWFPTGIVIFTAPTRPLVTQQIEACLSIAGIPPSACGELTGRTPATVRKTCYDPKSDNFKRVIFATPQTIENDLKDRILEARDVVCLVVDEAHKATGNYAYTGIVKRLMHGNGGKFRVLALSATPGSTGEAVQSVIDNLHIGRIQCRTDESIDIRPYIHKKHVDQEILIMPASLILLKDRLAALMKDDLVQLRNRGILHCSENPEFLAPFSCQQAQIEIFRHRDSSKKFAAKILQNLAALSRAMQYLCDESVKMAISCLKGHFLDSKDSEQASRRKYGTNKSFLELIADAEEFVQDPNYAGHPKMEKVTSLVLDHFMNHQVETKVIIFAQFRDCVDEIVDILNKHKPLIKAARFVGQSTDRSGRVGIKQKDQKEVVKQFRDGNYNTLVATSIGEEGLDIGEVDLIIIYEAQKSPIRMLQRIGRTGRARDGRIVVLMTKGRDEANWAKAQDNYHHVQNAILSGKLFECYGDVARMLPEKVKPVLTEQIITPVQFDAAEVMVTAKSKAKIGRQKLKRAVDQGALTGFTTAMGLLHHVNHKQNVKSDRKSLELSEHQTKQISKWMNPLKGKRPSPSNRLSRPFNFAKDASNGTFRISSHSRNFDILQSIFGEGSIGKDPQSWKEKLSAYWDGAEHFVHLTPDGCGERIPVPHQRVIGRQWKFVKLDLQEQKGIHEESILHGDEAESSKKSTATRIGFGKFTKKHYIDPANSSIRISPASTDEELPDFGDFGASHLDQSTPPHTHDIADCLPATPDVFKELLAGIDFTPENNNTFSADINILSPIQQNGLGTSMTSRKRTIRLEVGDSGQRKKLKTTEDMNIQVNEGGNELAFKLPCLPALTSSAQRTKPTICGDVNTQSLARAVASASPSSSHNFTMSESSEDIVSLQNLPFSAHRRSSSVVEYSQPVIDFKRNRLRDVDILEGIEFSPTISHRNSPKKVQLRRARNNSPLQIAKLPKELVAKRRKEERDRQRKELEKVAMYTEAVDSDVDAGIIHSSDNDDAENVEEDSSDRDFIDESLVADDSLTIYRQGLGTQAPGFSKPLFRGKAFFHEGAKRPILVTPGRDDNNDEYSFGSFVVDDEEIEYESSSQPNRM